MQIQNEQFQKFTDDKIIQKLQNSILKIEQTNKNKFNIFKVLKLDNYEIRHSNFLAWLLNPEETHNLGYEFIKEELGLEEEQEENKRGIIGTCAVKGSLGDRNA